MTGQLLGYNDGTYNPPATSVTREWLLCDGAGADCAALGSDPTASLLGVAGREQDDPPAGHAQERLDRRPGRDLGADRADPAVDRRRLARPARRHDALDHRHRGRRQHADGRRRLWLLMLSATRQWLRCSAVGAGCTPIASATRTLGRRSPPTAAPACACG